MYKIRIHLDTDDYVDSYYNDEAERHDRYLMVANTIANGNGGIEVENDHLRTTISTTHIVSVEELR